MAKSIFLVGLVFAAVIYESACQQSCPHAKAAASGQAVPPGHPPTVAHQHQEIPQVRQCRCDELEKCYQEQTIHYDDLTSRCRHECGQVFLANDTAEHVANCYDAYEKNRRDHKTNKHRCVEDVMGKPCLIDDTHQKKPTQTTLSVDPTKIAQPRVKRNYKSLFPPNVNLYASCVKTCRKNHGVVQFNPDGTIAKAKTNGNLNAQTNAGATTKNVAVKPGKGYASCAAQLGCQLVPVDKAVEKQAKQLCKYQQAQQQDHEHTLCHCLEGTFKQDFQCDSTTSAATSTCSSSSSQSHEAGSCQGTQAK